MELCLRTKQAKWQAPVAKHKLKKVCLVVIMLAGQNSHGADESYPFGRLFTGSNERLILDRLKRDQSRGVRKETAGSEIDPPEDIIDEALLTEEISSEMRFSGYVRRSDGTTTLWVDGTSNPAGQPTTKGQLAESTGEGTFHSQGLETQLRPGQTWRIDTNSVVEVYQLQTPSTEEPSASQKEPSANQKEPSD